MNKKEIIYLAIPYMHDDPNVMDFRADISDIIAADLANRDYNVFAPISAWHVIRKKYDLPGDWSFWHKFDEEFIKISGRIVVIMLYGWKQSTGVTAELKLADKFKLSVEYVDPTKYVTQIRKNYTYQQQVYDVYGKLDNINDEVQKKKSVVDADYYQMCSVLAGI